MAGPMTCWWATSPRPGNLGDVLSPVVLEGLGLRVNWASRGRARMISIGSIIGAVAPGQCVWGSGAMRRSDAPHPEAVYFAVRGPLTGDIVRARGGTCPDVYGDPALLLPTFHDRPVAKTLDMALVPHYIDAEAARGLDVPQISPLTGAPLVVVDKIRQCRSVVSSSLHGLIVAQAYGIPFAWLRMGDRLTGDDVKFHDFAASVGVELVPYKRLEDVRFVVGTNPPAEPMIQALQELSAWCRT